MRRVLWLIPVVLCVLFGATAQANDAPEWELFGGYSYLRVNVKRPSFHLNGGSASITQNLNDWFGARLEFNAFTGTMSNTKVNAQTYTYGPVFSTHKFEKFTPYAHVQFGAIHGSRGYLGISQAAFKFALAPGVGVDVRINDRAAVRLQADYLMTRFLGLRQDNLQGTAGIVIRLGRKLR